MTPETPCACYKCNGACSVKPGWFTPDEIPVLAQNMGLTEEELFKKHLQIDYWYGSEGGTSTGKDVFVLAPAANGRASGDFYPLNPRGQCVFFDASAKCGSCTIHTKGKPYECAKAMPCEDKPRADGESTNHVNAMRQWDNLEAQAYISRITGHETLEAPKAESIEDMLEVMFG